MYNAFISYSHTADGKLAPALQTALEKFAKPWYKVRYLNVFRDEDSLTASPHLWSSIEAALSESEYLVYMASPASASSKWTIKEIEYWLENKPLEKLLIVLTDGGIVWDDTTKSFLNKDINSLPDILENKFIEEPFYIDLRSARTQEDVSLNNPIFKKEVLKLAAQLHHKQPKDLAGEEVSAHSKIIRIRNAMIALLAFLLIAASSAAWFANKKRIEANEKTIEAKENKDKADSSAKFAILQSVIAREQRDSAVIARHEADSSAILAKLQKDTAQIERDNAIEQEKIAVNQKEIAEANYLLSEAKSAAEYDPTLGLRLAKAAMEKRTNIGAEEAAYKIYRENSFYKIKGRHNQTINSIAFSTDGKYILSSSKDSTARLWDLEGKLISECKDPSQLFCSALSRDGKYIGTGSRDGTARLWNMNGKIIKKFKGDSYVEAVAFSPDSKYILTGSFDSIARLWNLDGKMIQQFMGHSGQVTSVAFSPDGKIILTGSYDETAQLWSLTGKVIREFKNNSIIYSVAFSPNGTYVLTGSSDKTARLWDLNGRLIREFKGHSDAVTSVAFSPDGNFILTGSWDKTAILWDMDGNLIEVFKGNPTWLTAAFSPDGKSIITGGGESNSMYATPLDHSIRLWEIKNSYKEIRSKSPVMAVAFSPDKKFILTGSLDKTARLWDLNGKMILEFKRHSGAVNSVAFSQDGKFILTGSLDSTAALWDMKGRLIIKFEGHTGIINSVSFSPDGQSILTASGDGTSRLWDMEGKVSQIFPQESGVRCSLFSPGGKFILTATNQWGEMARLWDLHGKLIHGYFDITYSAMGVITMAFSPDGNSFVAVTGENKLWLWGINGKLIKEFKPLPQAITSVKFSPDGKTILTGSVDGIALLLNLSGNIIQEFKGHTDVISSVDFSPDGKYVLTGSYDKTARIWMVPMLLENFLNSGKAEALSDQQKKNMELNEPVIIA
ncbi:MAG TPA: TIR domain-containing protein [Chitinophagaceae bacterium]|nr:TIR domain-containing protein [Chitinophagaceae bacterium]